MIMCFIFSINIKVNYVPGTAASPTSEASAIQRLEASLAKVDASPASSPDMSRSVFTVFDFSGLLKIKSV